MTTVLVSFYFQKVYGLPRPRGFQVSGTVKLNGNKARIATCNGDTPSGQDTSPTKPRRLGHFHTCNKLMSSPFEVVSMISGVKGVVARVAHKW